MNDRLTKLLLFAIALGLWVNVADTIVRRASAAMIAQGSDPLALIANGYGASQKLC
jgi:hypothetical protein